MLLYTRDIKFDDKPDYNFMRSNLATIASEESIEFDFKYDWLEAKDSK